MTQYVALLRGINVGKAKRIAMADLRALFESLGYRRVQTLLNSGNICFEGPPAARVAQAQRILAAVGGQLGVDTLVVVKSATELAAVVAQNVFAAAATDKSRLLVAFTTDARSLVALAPWAQAQWGAEQVHLGGCAAYLWCPQGILKSRAAVALLKALADAGTTRNWATVEKVHALLQDPARAPV